MSPYIITESWPATGEEVQSRRAVATLEEARDLAFNVVDAAGGALIEADNLPEQGGTIGPFPDGTLIEVERVSGYALAQRLPEPIGLNPRSPDADKLVRILDAYNAAQGDKTR